MKDFFRLPNIIIDRGGELGPSAIAVAAVLARHADAQGVCWPSLTRIAALTGISRGTAMKAISRLQKIGVIVTSKKRRGFVERHIHQFTGWTGESSPQVRFSAPPVQGVDWHQFTGWTGTRPIEQD